MTKTKRFTALFTVLASIILLMPSQALAAAFGISPPWIVNENLKPGSSFVYVIDLNTDNPSHDQRVTTKVTGDPELADWIKIRGQENLTMPKGERHVPMYVELTAPPDAKLGRYRGMINIKVEPKNPAPGEVAIALGGNVEIDLNVINYDVVDYFVKSISIDPVAEGQPVDLSLKVKNLGNTRIESIPVQLELLDYDTGELVASASAKDLSHPVYPHTIKESKLRMNVDGLSSGTYWANLEAFKDGQVAYQNRLYLTVDDSIINSSAKTTVQVTTAENLKSAADEKMMMDSEKSRVNVKTQVTVRAPLTNQLIGVVIALLVVLIVITVKMYDRMNGRSRKRK